METISSILVFLSILYWTEYSKYGLEKTPNLETFLLQQTFELFIFQLFLLLIVPSLILCIAKIIYESSGSAHTEIRQKNR